MTKRILLIGAGGQLGQALRAPLGTLGEVMACDFPKVDLAEPASLRAAVRQTAPAVIVNAGAYTAVDRAEREPDRAFAVNGDGPAVLADEAAACGAVLVHYSTDYVFDGKKPTPYVETDPPAPLSIYGESKRAGELAVLNWERCLVLRTSWLVSGHGHNFVRTMLQRAGERDVLKVVDDQIGAPTSARLLSDVTAAMLKDLRSEGETRFGLYHCTAAGVTSWYGLAKRVIDRARRLGYPLKIAPEALVPITTAEYPTAAVRPANSRLDTIKLHTAFALDLPDWTVGTDAAVDALIAAGA
jgi:dTDP-4-dehydrorhamnose reductase